MKHVKIPKEYRDLEKLARDQGWEIEATKGGHLAWISPLGKKVFSPSTPSDRRSLPNVKSKLREAGLVTA